MKNCEMAKEHPRCAWAEGDALMASYHDQEWGVPQHDSRMLWEMLMLEGFQAGLAWIIVLRFESSQGIQFFMHHSGLRPPTSRVALKPCCLQFPRIFVRFAWLSASPRWARGHGKETASDARGLSSIAVQSRRCRPRPLYLSDRTS